MDTRISTESTNLIIKPDLSRVPFRTQRFQASRNELDVTLDVIKGQVPADLYGYVFMNSVVGTVNSNGLPYSNPPQPVNSESGSPLLNGDSMVYRFDLNDKGKIKLKTAILCTPCYYADKASRQGSDDYKKFGFRNWGIARVSPILGSRNQVNTAIVPVKFGKDTNPQLLATYDAGRPYEFDPKALTIKTPIGSTAEWTAATPKILRMPFALYESTAHPVFDPATQELFMVNFTKSMNNMKNTTNVMQAMEDDLVKFEQAIKKKIGDLEGKNDKESIKHELADFFANIEKHVPVKDDKSWFWKMVFGAAKLFMKGQFETEDAVYLMKWVGQGELQKWELVDENNKPLKILQTMHQMGLSKDYIVVTDSSMKFTMDLLINLPQLPHIEEAVRELFGAPMQYNTMVYLIKRSDLTAKNKKVKVKKVELASQGVHFSIEYANPGNEVTMYMAHNSDACISEWVRSFDKLKIEGATFNNQVIGFPAIGSVDIGRIGKHVINAETGVVNEARSKVIHLPGTPNNPKDVGANTWLLGLYTFRDMVSPVRTNDHIKTIFWQSYGLRPELLTKYIYKMYCNDVNRIVPVEEVVKLTAQGIPYTLSCLDTKTMTMREDYYQFGDEDIFLSMQFMPRHRDVVSPDLDLSTDGYIMCSVITGKEIDGKVGYKCQIMIFDAKNLSEPCCILEHPELDFAFTIHSAWIDKAETSTSTYNIDVKQDYNRMIKKIWMPSKQKSVQQFFDKNVYPHFPG